MPSCEKWLMINALKFQSLLHQLFFTWLSLHSYSSASHFTHLRSGLPMDLPMGLSFYFNLSYTFNFMLSLPVYTYCLFIGTILKLSSKWLLPHLYHWPIRGIANSIFMDFGADIHVIISIIGIHHFVTILLYGSVYMQLWLTITDLITLGPLSYMLFASPTIVPWPLTSSLIFHLLSTRRLICSYFMPPITKFRKCLLVLKPFLCSTIVLMMVLPSSYLSRKGKKHNFSGGAFQWRR